MAINLRNVYKLASHRIKDPRFTYARQMNNLLEKRLPKTTAFNLGDMMKWTVTPETGSEERYLQLPFPNTALQFVHHGKEWLFLAFEDFGSLQTEENSVCLIGLNSMDGKQNMFHPIEVSEHYWRESGTMTTSVNPLYAEHIKNGPERDKIEFFCSGLATVFITALHQINRPGNTCVRTPSRNPKAERPLPFDSSYTLVIAPSTVSETQYLGGTHRSPREHERRSHQRKLKSGKTVWVRSTTVGSGIGGCIIKDYKLESAA